MAGPPQLNLFLTIVKLLFGETTSVRSVLLRTLAIFLSFIIYLGFMYQQELVSMLQDIPKTSYERKLEEQRELSYPILAKERAVMLNSTLNPASVIILEYQPHFTNNDLIVVAQEGRIKVDWKYISVDKMSGMYQSNLLGEGFFSDVNKSSNPLNGEEFVFQAQLLRDLKIKYTFAYPIFDLANSYSGAIVILWDSNPVDSTTGHEDMTRRLRFIVLPSARALGRSK